MECVWTVCVHCVCVECVCVGVRVRVCERRSDTSPSTGPVELGPTRNQTPGGVSEVHLEPTYESEGAGEAETRPSLGRPKPRVSGTPTGTAGVPRVVCLPRGIRKRTHAEGRHPPVVTVLVRNHYGSKSNDLALGNKGDN